MGSNLGFVPIAVEYPRSNPVVRGTIREIFYVRYIDWFITTPLLLLDLMLTAGMPWPTILWTILVDEIMIVTGLIGALVVSRYKFAYFTIGTSPTLPPSISLPNQILIPTRLRRTLLHPLPTSLGSPPARHALRVLRQQMLHILRLAHRVPLDPVSHCLGTLRGRQRHLARLRGRVLRHSRLHRQARLRCSPHLRPPEHRSCVDWHGDQGLRWRCDCEGEAQAGCSARWPRRRYQRYCSP